MLLSSPDVALLITLILFSCRKIAYHRCIEALQDRYYLAARRCAVYKARLAHPDEEELTLTLGRDSW